MPTIVRDLEFRRGFIGPDIPRDQMPESCPDMRNVVLTPDGSSLVPMPGFERCYPYRLLQREAYVDLATGLLTYRLAPAEGFERLAKGLRIVAVPGEACGNARGRVLAIVDEYTGRILAFCWHPGGSLLDATTENERVPQALHRFNRGGPHDYPFVLNYGRLTRFASQVNEPWAWDGERMRPVGIRPPQAAPVIEWGVVQDMDDIPGTIAEQVPLFRIEYKSAGPNADPRIEIANKKIAFFLWDAATSMWVPDLDVNQTGTIALGDSGGRYSDIMPLIKASGTWDAELLDGRKQVQVEARDVGTAGNAIWIGAAGNNLSGGLAASFATAQIVFNKTVAETFVFQDVTTAAKYASGTIYVPASVVRYYDNPTGLGYYIAGEVRVEIGGIKCASDYNYFAPLTSQANAYAWVLDDLQRAIANTEGLSASINAATFTGGVYITAKTAGAQGNQISLVAKLNCTTSGALSGGTNALTTYATEKLDVEVSNGTTIAKFSVIPKAGFGALVSPTVGATVVYNDNNTGTGSLANLITALATAISASGLALTATADVAHNQITLQATETGESDLFWWASPAGSEYLAVSGGGRTDGAFKIPVGGSGTGARASGRIWAGDWNPAILKWYDTTVPINGATVVVSDGVATETYRFHTLTAPGSIAPIYDVAIAADLDGTIANLVAEIVAHSALLAQSAYASSMAVADLPNVTRDRTGAVDDSPAGNHPDHAGYTLVHWSYERQFAITGEEVWERLEFRGAQEDTFHVAPGLWDPTLVGGTVAAGSPTAGHSGAPDGNENHVHIWVRSAFSGVDVDTSVRDLAWWARDGIVPGSLNSVERDYVSISARIRLWGDAPKIGDYNLALVFDPTANFSSADAACVIVQIPPPSDSTTRNTLIGDTWRQVSGVLKQLADPTSLATLLSGNFTYHSIGLRLTKNIRSGVFRVGLPLETEGVGDLSGYGASEKWFQIGLDDVYFQPATAQIVAQANASVDPAVELPTTGFAFALSYIDSTNKLESALGPTWPSSGFEKIQDSAALSVDLAGVLAEWANPGNVAAMAGMENFPSAATIDRVGLYIASDSWSTGGEPVFHLFREYDLDYDFTSRKRIETLKRAIDEWDLDALLANREPYWTNYTMPSTEWAIVDRDRVIGAGQADYSVGQCGYEMKGETAIFHTARAFENATGDIAYFFNKGLNAAGIPDQGAGLPGDGYTIERRDLDPVWGPHQEGRTIAIGAPGADGLSTVQRGTIRKALRRVRINTDGNEIAWDGTYDRLWVEGVSKVGVPYALEAIDYTIEGYQRRVWWSLKSAAYGTNQEFCALWNYLDLDMPGDEIVGLGKVGDFVVVLGRKYTFYMLQDPGAMDDTADAAVFPRPRRFEVGCLGKRAFAEVPGGALWLSPDGVLMHATPEGIAPHATADLFAGWVRSAERVDQGLLEKVHVRYLAKETRFELFFAKAETGVFADWTDRPMQDRHVAWSSANPPAAAEIPFWEQV